MNYLSFLIVAAIIFDCGSTEESKSLFRDFIISTAEDGRTAEEQYSCNKCDFGRINKVIIQSMVNNRTGINSALDDGFMAYVYYKCLNVTSLPTRKTNEYYLSQKLCNKSVYSCKSFPLSLSEDWHNVSEQKINVDLNLPYDSKVVKIKTKKCVQEPIVFVFKIGNYSIDYKSNSDYKYDKGDFSSKNLDQSSIILSISKHPFLENVDITFNIRKSKCLDGLVKKSNNALGYKCFIKTSVDNIEAGYTFTTCPGSGGLQSITVKRDLCKYYEGVCKGLCYNMDGCSYVCLESINGVLVEGGYVMNATLDHYPNMIGSRRWKKDKLPLELVIFDECKHEPSLCENGSQYCVDNDTAFTCTDGNYTLKECLKNKDRSPYWQCPLDESDLLEAIMTPGTFPSRNNSNLYKDAIMRAVTTEQKTAKALELMYRTMNTLSNKNSSSSFNLSLNERRKFASFLIKNFVDYLLSLSTTKFTFKNDFLYHYSEDIPVGKEEINIHMSPESTENKSQYIKLELERSKTESMERITTNYFQYKDMDMMNETEAVESIIENMKLIKDSRISPEDFDEDEDEKEVLYKNSVMFTLKVNGTKYVKAVKYRLDMIKELRPTSWLYEVDNVCGFLVEGKNWTWSREGCWFVKNVSVPYCECNHLSNFAMLFSIKEVNKAHLKVLEVLSIIAAVINVASLILFLIFILLINSREKLRIDQLNIAICLLCGTIIFMSGSLFSKNETMCSLSALASQFLFLSAFMWKFILGINVIRLIASLRFQNEDWMVKYPWLLLVAGYTIPLVIVIISGSIYWQDYGLVSDKVCWIDASSRAFLSFLIPVGIIVAVNTLGLFFIANTLIRNYMNTRKTRMNESNELVVFIQLLVSMGLTWIPSYFAILYLYAMYLFILFFPLQGLLMFLLVVVINKENREKVSCFLVNSYLTLTSKSISTSDGKVNSKSKSSGQSKATEESDNLLTTRDKSQEKEECADGKLLVISEEDTRDDLISKC